MGPHKVNAVLAIAQRCHRLQQPAQVFVGVMAAEHQQFRFALIAQRAKLSWVEAQLQDGQAACWHANAAMHLPGRRLGIAEHVASAAQHQRHIGQVISQQRRQLRVPQRQQVMGQHHRRHACQQGGFRQWR